MRKLLAVTIAVSALTFASGCATVLGAVGISAEDLEKTALEYVESKRQAAEFKKDYVTWSICKDMRMEQWTEMFGTEKGAEAWKTLCTNDSTNVVVPLQPPDT